MLVYGDPRYSVSADRLIEDLRSRAAVTITGSLEGVRILLIQAGQLEQGAFDSWPSPGVAEQAFQRQTAFLTDHAARAFCSHWVFCSSAGGGFSYDCREELARFRGGLDRVSCPKGTDFTIKIPEGFEFYNLYPEQYCASAMKWARDRAGADPKEVLVAGIRSIGTTLSAVVTAILQAEGWRAKRLTLRPVGHPFARSVEEQSLDVSPATCALVVDEGPGLSGSSMAAVAEWLARSGISDISFFPGHGGEPGSAASPETRRWWNRAPRYLTRVEDLRWNGRSLIALLAEESRAFVPGGEGAARIEDLSGGLWRGLVYADASCWPAAYAPFERTKYRWTGERNGSVLWKFTGLGCRLESGETSVERMLRQAEVRKKWVPPVLGSCHGFSGMPWVEGVRFAAGERLEPRILAKLGAYVAVSSRPPLEDATFKASVSRLAEMLYWNTKEALGEAAAEQTRAWSNRALLAGPGRTYGDGRMAPHEWMRTSAGRLVKTDSAGHDADHTMIGRQSVLWDIAGTIVEWDLQGDAAGVLAKSIPRASAGLEGDALTFYRMAYAAFRLGQASLCACQCGDEAERARFHRAVQFYRKSLVPP